MEGVLVSASKTGSPVTVTVVTGKDGRFFFPVSKLAPGQYSLGVRAVGYDLDAPKAIEITEQKTTTADLQLRKTEDLAAQLSNGEWLASIPGTDQQKGQLLNCVGCHTLERIVRSKYDANAFLTQVLPRMQGYVNQSIPAHPQLRRAERLMEERGDQRVQVYRAAAEYLSTINLSTGSQWSYALKTFARPTGRATRVIYTEYGLPRETISPHDVIVDADGIVWYSSFGEQNLGKLDPKSGKVTEYPIPEHKPGFPTGGLGLRADKDGNLWLGNMYQATIIKFDRKAESFQFWPLPPEQNIDAAQVNMVSPQSSHVDGKVWTQNNGFAGVHRLDIATGKIETWEPFKNAPKDLSTSSPTPGTTSISPISATSISGVSTPRPGRSSSSRLQRLAPRRGAEAWMRRIVSGLASTVATASECSIPERSSSRSGSSPRAGHRPMMSLSTKTRTHGPDR